MLIPLHTHSFYSFYAGVPSVKELVTRAKALGFPALALTDTDRMSGLIRFYNACREQGIKPILGTELTDPGSPDRRIVLLAKNARGYGDLCEIITQRHLDADFSFVRAFSRPWADFFFITSSIDCLDLLARSPNRANLYAELINQSPETRSRSREVESRAREWGIPPVVTNDSYFLDRSDWETHRILRSIGLLSTLSRLRPDEYATEKAYLRPAQEIERLFPDHGIAIENTRKIADACAVELDTGKWIMPEIEVPKGYSPESYLREQALRGLENRYGGSPVCERAREILSMELSVIEKLGFASYFLIVKDVRDWADRTFARGYRRPGGDCTILRGSAANSITFYALGVSDLDPIRYDLYFRRFLNEDRASPPDADLDFGWDEREQALEYMAQRWGRDRVAITCTFNHFRGNAAFRETAKVFGYTDEQITAIFKERRAHTGRIDDREIHRLYGLAMKIRGKPRFLGQHPGGVLVTNDPIRRHVACECSGGDKPRIITQIDMHSGIDDLGLIKFDLLGNGSLSVLRDTIEQLRTQRMDDPEVWNLDKCFNDPEVREIISNGRTRGIFYIESPAQMRLNRKMQSSTFEEVTISSSLVRPAGASYTATFVERHRKKKAGEPRDWQFLHPALEPILGDTYDVCAFQEDVTKICHQVAGLGYKKADKIRKMINSLHEGNFTHEEIDAIAQEFIDGCVRTSGLSQPQAFELWKRVSSFTGFSFCKSHSASYAQLSFKCAYLKAHYPAQFLSSVISNRHGFYTPSVYLDEARRWRVRILPVNINESDIAYRGKHQWIRPGFMHIRSMGRTSMENIVHERAANGYFRNLTDFVDRVPIRRSEIESLILVGAFDGFGLIRPESLYLLDGIYGKRSDEEPSLLPALMPYGTQSLHPGFSDYTFAEKCLHELQLLGFMLSGNILDILDLHPAARDAVHADRVGRFVGKRIKIFGWPIARRDHEVARSGGDMVFLTIEDKTETVDVILWPDVYERYHDVVTVAPPPYEIWGTVSEDYGTYTVEADTMRSVAWSPAQIDFQQASQRLEKSFVAYGEYYGSREREAA